MFFTIKQDINIKNRFFIKFYSINLYILHKIYLEGHIEFISIYTSYIDIHHQIIILLRMYKFKHSY